MHQITSDADLLSKMSPLLQGTVALAANRRWLGQVWYFKRLGDSREGREFIASLAKQLVIRAYVSHERLPVGYLYILKRGLVVKLWRFLGSGKESALDGYCWALLGPARPCSALLGPARPCSALLGPARPCSALLGLARAVACRSRSPSCSPTYRLAHPSPYTGVGRRHHPGHARAHRPLASRGSHVRRDVHAAPQRARWLYRGLPRRPHGGREGEAQDYHAARHPQVLMRGRVWPTGVHVFPARSAAQAARGLPRSPPSGSLVHTLNHTCSQVRSFATRSAARGFSEVADTMTLEQKVDLLVSLNQKATNSSSFRKKHGGAGLPTPVAAVAGGNFDAKPSVLDAPPSVLVDGPPVVGHMPSSDSRVSSFGESPSDLAQLSVALADMDKRHAASLAQLSTSQQTMASQLSALADAVAAISEPNRVVAVAP